MPNCAQLWSSKKWMTDADFPHYNPSLQHWNGLQVAYGLWDYFSFIYFRGNFYYITTPCIEYRENIKLIYKWMIKYFND